MDLVTAFKAAGVAEVFFPAAVGDVFGGVVPAVAVGHGEPVITRVGEGVEGFVGVRGVGVEFGKEDGLFFRREGGGRGDKTGDGGRRDRRPGTGDRGQK